MSVSTLNLASLDFNIIANEWYQSSINELGVVNKNNKPLIVMSFITLFKYNTLFYKDGFKHYFDLYLKDILKDNADYIITKNQTFDFLMSRYSYHMEDLQLTVSQILRNKVKRNMKSSIHIVKRQVIGDNSK